MRALLACEVRRLLRSPRFPGLDAAGVHVLLAWLVAVGGLVIARYRRDALRV